MATTEVEVQPSCTISNFVGIDFAAAEASGDFDASFEQQMEAVRAFERAHAPLPAALQGVEITGPRCLILRDQPETKVGLLHIPDSAQTEREKVLTGTVVRIGTGGPMVRRDKKTSINGPDTVMIHGQHHYESPVAVGDRVLYGFLDGEDFEEDGRVWTILPDADVRAIL